MTPLLLLVPGMLNTPRVFDRALQRAELQVEVRVLDVSRQDDIPAMSADGWAQLANVEPARPLLLAGYSMGGYVALNMLATAPRPVQGLALIASSARADSEQGASLRQRAIAAIERDFERYLYSLLGFMLSADSQADADFVAQVRADMRAVGVEAAVRQQRAAATRADQRRLLNELALPIEVLCGSADTVTPPHLSHEIAGLAPRARLDVVDGAGHLLPFEHPGPVAATLQRLVDRAIAPD
jgi:pimeloyl-ACP methyl ester carboxylesterase